MPFIYFLSNFLAIGSQKYDSLVINQDISQSFQNRNRSRNAGLGKRQLFSYVNRSDISLFLAQNQHNLKIIFARFANLQSFPSFCSLKDYFSILFLKFQAKSLDFLKERRTIRINQIKVKNFLKNRKMLIWNIFVLLNAFFNKTSKFKGLTLY